jgi:protein-tyrosine phosphatase
MMKRVFPFSSFQRTHLFADYRFLGVDMHSHILPGIDDGAKNVTESLALVSGLKELGFESLFATPHVITDRYPNTPATIIEAMDLLCTNLSLESKPVQLAAAAEYMMDDGFGALIGGGKLLTLPGNRVLVELSYIAASPGAEDQIFQLCIGGYIPVMAHPERYQYWHRSADQFSRLIDIGCELQVNLLSLAGYYGKGVERCAHQLVEAGMVSFIGTDLHNNGQLEVIRTALSSKKIARLFSKHQFKNISLV